MLVRFSVKNFASFKEEAVLDLSAIDEYKEHQYNLIDIGTDEKFLKVVAIYGANASGKSNLYFAFRFFVKLIMESINNVSGDGEKVIERYHDPFFFDADENENTEFELINVIDDYEYRYGFEYNSEMIVNEWLYRKKTGTKKQSVVFERNETGIVSFGIGVKKECDIYKEQISNDTLVLSFFNKLRLKTDVFAKLYNEITSSCVVDTDWYTNERMLKRRIPEIINKDKNKLLQFLRAIDSGVEDIFYEVEGTEKTIYTVHKDKNSNTYDINLFDESAGTIKCIGIFIYASVVNKNNSVMFVDELNVRLHPLLLKFIIDLFYESDSTAQLIYTTHDTTLLDKKFFRRDQIYFVQKDEYGYSELVALSDYEISMDAEFEKDYLAGVYGGIPTLKEFSLGEGE